MGALDGWPARQFRRNIMGIGRLNFDDINEQDLLQLVENGVPEGILIEYKQAMYGRADADRREFLKDVTALANTSGGHLLIGIREENLVAAGLSPLKIDDPDAEILRLENLLRDGVEPRLIGTRIRWVPVAAGGGVVVLRVAKSWQPPHRVSIGNTNRFYVRNSGGVHEASVHELKTLFTSGATAYDRARAFRQERVAKVEAGEGPIELAPSTSKLFVHIVPVSAFSGGVNVPLTQFERDLNGVVPIGCSSGFNNRFNYDGFLAFRGGPRCHGYTQQFRNGSIEATYVGIVGEGDGRRVLRCGDFAEFLSGSVPRYLDGLRKLDVPSPLLVMVTLTGMERSVLSVRSGWGFDDHVSIRQSTLELPEIVVDDYGTREKYQRTLRPTFDALWNAGGFAQSECFAEDGSWQGLPRR
jgi:hypothetical protein